MDGRGAKAEVVSVEDMPESILERYEHIARASGTSMAALLRDHLIKTPPPVPEAPVCSASTSFSGRDF